MNRIMTVAVAGAALALGVATEAMAQAKPDVLVKQRQAAMTLIGKYFGPVAGMASGKVPYNADVVARNATYLENLSQMPWDGFHESTKGEKSRTLPEAYSQKAKFDEIAERMQAEIAKLGAVARAKNEAGVKQQFGAVGKTCGACHDGYRAK
ncbi:MAG: c-type cytochrome [Betaproteobacteria bacterium]